MSTREEVPTMARENLIDIDLHHQLKYRAYNLYDRLQAAAVDGDLKTELGYVAYAAAVIQKYSNGKESDCKAVRAARVYLQALSTVLKEREMN